MPASKLFSHRSFRHLLLAILPFSSRLIAQTPAPPQVAPWLGINHGDLDQPLLISDLQKLGLHIVREGFNASPDAKLNANDDVAIAPAK